MNRYEALKHAVKAHAGQTDKCGQPYVLHPIAVAEVFDHDGLPTYVFDIGTATTEDAVVVALLHDVLEDTNYDLPSIALNAEQRQALKAITRASADSHTEYIDCLIEMSPLAMVVKLADLWHNLQPERQDCLPAKERASLEKRYLKARERIWEALGYEWWPGGGTDG